MNEETRTSVEVEEEENAIVCEHCGCEIYDDDYTIVDDEIICSDCIESYYVRCDECGDYVLDSDSCGDDNIALCEYCYDNHYTRCECCNRLIHNDDSYNIDDYYYCEECYNKRSGIIHAYGYKPSPIFYGTDKRYFGVELELDIGGNDEDNAEKILDIANYSNEHIYIKNDGGIKEGLELVTHPMTLNYHTNEMPWKDILHKAVYLGYRSHQTTTCGLHIHVSRNSLGYDEETQENTISRILYFVESHWNEIVKFSRRTEYSLNRWAARHGYEKTPQEILKKAKCSYNRYVCINLANTSTIEFRIFRGTLKYNTLIATIQLVNHICETACKMNDTEIAALSWSDFVATVNESELIQYLKERRLYINEEVNNEEDI
ncbi:MAG: amidoligase family protein [Oscillospiraceae bacterium]